MKFAVCIYKLTRYVLYVALPFELQRHIEFLGFTTSFQPWWHWQDSNLQPTGYKPKYLLLVSVERLPGIEPGTPPWQGGLLPLHHRRLINGFFLPVPPTKTVELGRMFYLLTIKVNSQRNRNRTDTSLYPYLHAYSRLNMKDWITFSLRSMQ